MGNINKPTIGLFVYFYSKIGIADAKTPRGNSFSSNLANIIKSAGISKLLLNIGSRSILKTR